MRDRHLRKRAAAANLSLQSIRDAAKGLRGRSLFYGMAILLAGLAYRATFLSQGFAATDEGWLQSLGRRIAAGQVPYRDFDYVLPPVSIYKEAVLIGIFQDAYGVLASRWAFAAEAALGSLLAFVIVRRFVRPAVAFWVTVPTVPFVVILYYFSNYNYDAEFLLLGSVALIVYSNHERRLPALLAGMAAGLAFLTKPTYLGFVPLVPVIEIVRARWATTGGPGSREPGHRPTWPLFLLGVAVVVAAVSGYLAAMGAGPQFIYQAFLLSQEAHPSSLGFLLTQDLPGYLRSDLPGLSVTLGLLLLLAVQLPGWKGWLRLSLTTLVSTVLLLLTVARQGMGPRPTFLLGAFVLLWALNILGFVLALMAHAPWFRERRSAAALRAHFIPPELALYAMALQYLAQYTFSGVVLYYVGAFLTVPVALLVLHGLAQHAVPIWERYAIAVKVPALASLVLGLWLVAGSILVTRATVYQDADRSQLTGTFRSPKLSGITSLPSTAQRIDGVMATLERYSKPGEPIFAFPDLAVLYFLSDRANATRITWYNTGMITEREVDEAVADLARRPPRVVFLLTYRESDFRRLQPLDYQSEPKWRRMYQYLRTHFRQVETVQDVRVLVPNE